FHSPSIYETLRQVREQDPVSPGAAGGQVDRDLEAICLKCLEKDPRRRYSSAECVAADLERWLSGGSGVARPIGQFPLAWRWCRRNRVVAALAASVAALLVTIACVATFDSFRQHALAESARTAASREKAAAAGEREQRLLSDARAEEIRWRLVRMNVEN